MYRSIFIRRPIANTVAVLALSVLSACGGGGGAGMSSGGTPATLASAPVSYVSPDNGAPVKCCAVEFVLRNGSPSKYTGGVYQITLYSDSAGLQTLGASDSLAENTANEARWTPSVTLEENKAYWWRWKAQYATKSVTSAQGAFYVTAKSALKAMAPRHTGWMDSNFAGKPTFSVFNAYTGEGAPVSYDIELYADESLSNMVISIAGQSQDSGRYTSWFPNISALNSGAVYYWRARAAMNGFATEWAGPYSFTVKNPCAITGSKYASYAIDWKPRRQCSAVSLTDPTAALGPPDAGNSPWRNFISLDDGGEVTLEMGETVIDQSGADIRVYQYVSDEPLEVLAGPTEVGPWYSLGTAWCQDPYCDFDLADAGVAYARYIKIRDLTSPAQSCHETSGADIDAVMWLNPVSETGGCGAFGGTAASSTSNSGADTVTHSVPGWIKGGWSLIEIGMGSDYTGYNMTFSVTDTGFEYQYPGCNVKGRLSMDPNAPMTSANWYVMSMDQVDCAQQWDISTAAGVTDAGYIWGVNGGRMFYRSSFYNNIDFWIYTR